MPRHQGTLDVDPTQAAIPHVVVFSELSPRARAQYARFLIKHNVKFAKRPSDGRYVANICIAMPPSAAAQTTADDRVQTPTTTRMLVPVPPASDPGYGSPSSDSDNDQQTHGIPVHIRRYAALIHQFGVKILHRQSHGMYTIESKLVRLINDVYDARAEEEPDSQSKAESFASFSRVYLTNRFGLKSLIDQQAMELVEGLHTHRNRRDVELFARFMDGTYDDGVLDFFLKVRDTSQNEIASASVLFRPTTAASARRRNSNNVNTNPRRRASSRSTTASPTPCWMSKQQIEAIAQRVFGSKSDDAFLQFAHDVRAFVTRQSPARATTELLELHELYTLAIETYGAMVDREPATRRESGSTGPGGDSRIAYDGCDESTSTSPSPSPLPPPPLPRTFGQSLRVGAATPVGTGWAKQVEIQQATRLYDPPRPRVEISARKQEPDEVQARLSSLLDRMQQRRTAD